MNFSSLTNRQFLALVIFGLLVVAIPFMVIAVKLATDPRANANPLATPREVLFSNITGSSFTMSYITDEAVTGSGLATSGSSNAPGIDPRDTAGAQEHRVHYLVFTNLAANTTYTVTVYSDGGQLTDPAWKVTTNNIGDVGTPDPYLGKISITGQEAVVYTLLGDTSGNSNLGSALVNSQNGTFTVDRGNMTTSTGNAPSTNGKDLLVYINALDSGRAKEQFAATEKNLGTIELEKGTYSISPADKITPGSDPDKTGGGGDVIDPIDTPDNPTDYTLDTFSESLLQSTYTDPEAQNSPIAPREIFISDVSPTGFTVNWRTLEPTFGYIQIGEGETGSKVVDRRDGNISSLKKRFTHSVRASDSSIPAGTILKFYLIVNQVQFGVNAGETIAEIDEAFASHIQNNVSKNAVFTPGTLPSQLDYSLIDFETAPTPFQVIIPEAPDSPPLPNVIQGTASMQVTPTVFNSLLSSLTQYNNYSSSNFDSDDDIVVYAKTNSGTWTSAAVSSTGGYSLSVGSSVTSDKTKYVEIEDGDTLEIRAYGLAGQSISKNITFGDEVQNIELTGPMANLGFLNYTILNTPLFVGYGNSAIYTLNNSQTSNLTNTNSANWILSSRDIPTGVLLIGQNSFALKQSTSNINVNYSFALVNSELPVTSLDTQTIILIVGFTLIGAGVVVYFKYRTNNRQYE